MREACQAATAAAREAEASAAARAGCVREQHERALAEVRREAAAELEAARTKLQILRRVMVKVDE